MAILTSGNPTTSVSASRLRRVTGVLGLVALPLLFVPVIAVSTLGEPPFDGTPTQVVTFFDAVAAASWGATAEAVQVIGTMLLLWWAVGLTGLLRRAEGDVPWRSSGALVSAGVFAAYVVVAPLWGAVAYRGSPTEDVAVFAFDAGNLGFANAWVALGSVAAGCGWVVVETHVLPVWTGWLALASAAGFVGARFVWTTGVWFVPYAMFWVWVVATSVALLRVQDVSASDVWGGVSASGGPQPQ